MKKIFNLCLLSVILITSNDVNALDKKTLEWVKEDRRTMWYIDKDTDQWVYFKDGELLKNDWLTKDLKHKYYFKEDGLMAKGWILINNNWYFFNDMGAMCTGWIQNNSNWYYLNADGTMAHDTYINNYYVNSNGVWVK